MRLLCQAAGMKDTKYARQHKQTKIVERIAQSTMPFVSTHILASTFAHENKASKKYSSPKTRGITESVDEFHNY